MHNQRLLLQINTPEGQVLNLHKPISTISKQNTRLYWSFLQFGLIVWKERVGFSFFKLPLAFIFNICCAFPLWASSIQWEPYFLFRHICTVLFWVHILFWAIGLLLLPWTCGKWSLRGHRFSTSVGPCYKAGGKRGRLRVRLFSATS